MANEYLLEDSDTKIVEWVSLLIPFIISQFPCLVHKIWVWIFIRICSYFILLILFSTTQLPVNVLLPVHTNCSTLLSLRALLCHGNPFSHILFSTKVKHQFIYLSILFDLTTLNESYNFPLFKLYCVLPDRDSIRMHFIRNNLHSHGFPFSTTLKCLLWHA